MKRLSIIIVSYNVSAFLEKCLRSVYQALGPLEADVIVVDNRSVDDSVVMVRKRFPSVKLIENVVNVGFGTANNQAMEIVTTPYALLLNPDTLINEDTLEECLAFMDSHPDAAAVGVKMFDGSGNYLPESKRGFPTPWRALCRMSGLSSLFPNSRLFNGYYLGHLDDDAINEIEVLTGAFMFLRTEAMRKVGGFDEDFFMYGEDIDLSYRLMEAGYRNYYLPATSIIHYKGESAKKSTLNYVRSFYQAMIIFLDKHYSGIQHFPLLLLIKLGIYLRAIATGLRSAFRAGLPVIVDTLLFCLAVLLSQYIWSRYYYQDPSHFDLNFYRVNLPMYTLVFTLFCFLSGVYDMYYSLRRLFAGMVAGVLAILVVYAMLNAPYRSSRAVIVLSGVIGFWLSGLVRFLAHRIENKTFRLGYRRSKHAVLIAGKGESERIMELLNRSDAYIVLDAILSPTEVHDPDFFDSSLEHIEEVLAIYRSEELIFSAHDVPFQEITSWMNKLGNQYEFKIASAESQQIVGSKSKTLTGQLYSVDFEYRLARGYYKRNKRIFDLASSFLLLLFSPVYILFLANRGQFLHDIIDVLIGNKTWIGYYPIGGDTAVLPQIRPGVFPTTSNLPTGEDGKQVAGMKNSLYAREYSVGRDIELLLRQLRQFPKYRLS